MGQSIWTWYESSLGREVPFPSAADAGYLAAAPLASAGLLAMPVGPRPLAGLLRTILDGLVVALALFCTSWILVLGPLFDAGGDGLLSTIPAAGCVAAQYGPASRLEMPNVRRMKRFHIFVITTNVITLCQYCFSTSRRF